MTFEEYQKQALTTVLTTGNEFKDLLHWVLGINGEAGEVAEKVKKIIRDKNGVITDEDKKRIVEENITQAQRSLYSNLIQAGIDPDSFESSFFDDKTSPEDFVKFASLRNAYEHYIQTKDLLNQYL
jgi:hypothetical protein